MFFIKGRISWKSVSESHNIKKQKKEGKKQEKNHHQNQSEPIHRQNE